MTILIPPGATSNPIWQLALDWAEAILANINITHKLIHSHYWCQVTVIHSMRKRKQKKEN
jgi:hypothetical protein